MSLEVLEKLCKNVRSEILETLIDKVQLYLIIF